MASAVIILAFINIDAPAGSDAVSAITGATNAVSGTRRVGAIGVVVAFASVGLGAFVDVDASVPSGAVSCIPVRTRAFPRTPRVATRGERKTTSVIHLTFVPIFAADDADTMSDVAFVALTISRSLRVGTARLCK